MKISQLPKGENRKRKTKFEESEREISILTSN